MSDHEELVGFDCRFVLNTAVLWNTDTVQRGGQCAQTADYRGTFQCSDNPDCQWTEHKKWTNSWNNEKGRPEQQPPKSAPECSPLAPDLHAVTGIVITDDMFLRVIVLANNGELLHVETCQLKFFDAGFCFDVSVENPCYGVMLGHGVAPFGLMETG